MSVNPGGRLNREARRRSCSTGVRARTDERPVSSTSSSSRRLRRYAASLGVFVLFAGMLFWTKLRLVSDIPRSAYAVPGENADKPQDTTAQPDSEVETDEDEAPDDEDGDREHPADHADTPADND